jgi:hypothetical protein
LAQFRTTSDIVDTVLTNGGEVTNGNSPYEAQVLSWLNRVHYTLISGGTIALGKDTTVEIDEVWPWARSARPLILELQPKIDEGSVTLTLGSEAGVFSSAPSVSVAGWYLQVIGRDEILRIASHTAASVNFELDGAYPDPSGSGLNYKVFKLDYELLPDMIVIDSFSNKIDFKKTAGGSLLTATLTAGTYTPSALATHVASVMTAAASGPTITGSYSATSRKFTFVSDGAAATVLQLVFATGTNQLISAHKVLGYDDEDLTGALTYTSTYSLGNLSRIIEPFKMHKGASLDGSIYGIDSESFQRDYPFSRTMEGFPDRFSVIREVDGVFTVRFNRFPKEKTRVEVENTPIPRDLKDSAGSIPLVPRKHMDVLEDAATFYLMLVKSDDRMSVYMQLTQGKLKAMIAQHRGSQVRSGKLFGQIVSRPEMQAKGRRKLIYGYE